MNLLSMMMGMIAMITSQQLATVMSPQSDANFSIPVASCPVPPDAIKLNNYLVGTTRVLDKRMQQAIRGIEGLPKRLLAVKYYLRRRGQTKSAWAWSRSETERYMKTPSYHKSMAEVAKVRKIFEGMNPGYTIKVNTEIRPLGEQIRIWNSTASIETAGNDLYKKTLVAMADTTWPDRPEKSALLRFQKLLLATKVIAVPTAAVPGFSQHGQLRAFDFIITKGEAIVAGTDYASQRSVWDAPGWTEKLQTAIDSAGNNLTGPLASPREPWHYTYTR